MLVLLMRGFIKYVVEMVSGGMMHVLIFMTFGSGIRPTIWVLRQQFETALS
jgi:hypothetical protein